MPLNPDTIQLLSTLNLFSGDRLTCQTDLGSLLQVAAQSHEEGILDDLSFTAKFISRAYGIMQRIGQNGEGYEKLATEFSAGTKKLSELMRLLLHKAPRDMQEHFESTYLAMTPEGFRNLLALCYDLSWYKNWLIDGKPTT